MHGDDESLDRLQREIQEGLTRLGTLETQVEKLWKEMHGLREMIEERYDLLRQGR